MAAWHGRRCGSRNATFAGIVGYPKPRNRQTVLVRSAAQPCGTREALTAGRVQPGSRWGVVAGRRRDKNDGDRRSRLRPTQVTTPRYVTSRMTFGYATSKANGVAAHAVTAAGQTPHRDASGIWNQQAVYKSMLPLQELLSVHDMPNSLFGADS